MFASATAQTRRVAPSCRPWADVATKGQLEAVAHLTSSYSGLLVADPGAGKTAITLSAFATLRQSSQTATLRMLVVAPLKVCQLVWRQEAQAWTEFQNFRIAFLHGGEKDRLIEQPHDVALINFEGLQWLSNKFFGKRLPYDVVCIDETTKVKHHRGERARALRARLRHVRYRWGLTGSLVPNGYEDLFGQMLMLDDGAALGKSFTNYREMYFQQGFDGFTWTLRRNAAAQIEDRIRPYVYRLPYTELPPLDDVIHMVQLEPAERKKYEALKRDMIVQLEGQTITTANAGGLYSKLKQMASGAVYTGGMRDDGQKEWVHVHDAKIEAVGDLLAELHGSPLLLGYEFRHELERLREAFPYLRTFDGLKEGAAADLERAWNENEVSLLAAHPASIGHGLNLQKGGACHVAWFTAAIDYDLYDQFIRRVRRRGNDAGVVINHLFIAKDTVDETLTLPGIRNKGITQDALLASLAQHLNTRAAGSAANAKEHGMSVLKLGRQTQVAQAAPAPVAGRITPSSWNKQAAAAPAREPVTIEGTVTKPAFGQRKAVEQAVQQVSQRQQIEERLTQTEPEQEQPPAEAVAAEMMDQTLGETAGEMTDPHPTPPLAPAPRERRKRTTVAVNDESAQMTSESYAQLQSLMARQSALDLAIKYQALPHANPEDDIFEISELFADYIKNGRQVA